MNRAWVDAREIMLNHRMIAFNGVFGVGTFVGAVVPQSNSIVMFEPDLSKVASELAHRWHVLGAALLIGGMAQYVISDGSNQLRGGEQREAQDALNPMADWFHFASFKLAQSALHTTAYTICK